MGVHLDIGTHPISHNSNSNAICVTEGEQSRTGTTAKTGIQKKLCLVDSKGSYALLIQMFVKEK